jgi:hypothetical protein
MYAPKNFIAENLHEPMTNGMFSVNFTVQMAIRQKEDNFERV